MGLNFHVAGSKDTVMRDRPTEQRQPENQTATSDASSDHQLGPVTPTGIPMKSNHQQVFLPLNPDFLSPSVFPLLEPIKDDNEHENHTKPMNNVQSVKEKEEKVSATNDGPKKFPGVHKSTQPTLTKPSNTHHEVGDIHITTTTTTEPPPSTTKSRVTTEVSTALKTEEQEEPESLNKALHPIEKDVSSNEGKLQPYQVKPPFLPEYEEDHLDDSEQPIMWIHPQHRNNNNNNNNHDHSNHHSEAGNLPSVRPDKTPLDNPQYGGQNHLHSAESFIPPNSRPASGSREVYQDPDIPGSTEIQYERPSTGHSNEGRSDPHLDQILKHLQRQGIIPEHYTILQQEESPSQGLSPQQHKVQRPSQHGDAAKRPDSRPTYESDSDHILIHPPFDRVPPQYRNEYTPKPIPRPDQPPSLYQTGITQPMPNSHRNSLPHLLFTNRYPDQPGRQPDTDGPLVAHLPYQGLLVPHQYHGVPHIPPHVDIDHLLLTSQGRHNQSHPG
jgi:hypothetical protein